jgi:L-ribulokinase
MAFIAAGVFPSIEAAQQKLCLPFKAYQPKPEAATRYERLYRLYRKAYFALGTNAAEPAALGGILPQLRNIAAEARRASRC